MDAIAERAGIDRVVSGKTVCTMFAEAVAKWGDRPALHWKDNGDWRTLTWREYRDDVAAVTLGLRSLGFGPGQFGLIMARNAPEHVIADLGIAHAGGAAISVYNTLAPEQIEYIANHSEATLAFVEDEGFLDKFMAIRASTPNLRNIVLVRGSAPTGVMTWESLLARGRELYAAQPAEFERTWHTVGPEDTVSLIYTSGTTGPPKGVVYSHNNVVWTCESSRRAQPLNDQRLVSFLPLAHILERMASQWQGIYNGHEVWLCPDPNLLMPYLAAARPTLFVGVPRVWEKLMAGLRAGVAAEPDESKRKMAQGALSASISAYRLKQERQEVPDQVAAAIEQAQPLFGLLRAKIGLDQCQRAVTTSAPSRPEVHEFFAAIGLPLYEIWGMSELTGPGTQVYEDEYQVPSIGRAYPGMEAKLGNDGELLIRGGNVMVGYYKEPGKTADMIDSDGWLHTGDIAEPGPNGQFRIIDRKKELIITSAGKNISPSNLESLAKSSPLIGQAVAIGDSRNFISVLVVLDPQVAPAWAKARGIEASSMAELADHPQVIEEVRRALNAGNAHLSRVEQFKRFTILPTEWSPESEELTPTLKLKRRVINNKYQAQIEAMYGNPPGGHAVDLEREAG